MKTIKKKFLSNYNIGSFFGLTEVTISNYKRSSKIEDNRKYFAMKDYFRKWVEENKNVSK